MRLGTRLPIVTTGLAAVVTAGLVAAAVRDRRAELQRDLEAEARAVATVIAASLQRRPPEDWQPAVRDTAADLAAHGSAFSVEWLGGTARPDDPGWAQLVEAARAARAPRGALFELAERRPLYAMAIPLYAPEARAPQAFVGLRRDATSLEAAVATTARHLAVLGGLGVLVFGLVVRVLLRGGVVRPLRRLIAGVDEVASGDLSSALLPESDDEIGSLAQRFNAMTTSLRRARTQEAAANDARLAMEARLHQAEKLATMGQMAAEIAHEVGTPLQVIGGRAGSLARRPADPIEVQKNAGIIGEQVERITRIIQKVLAFSRKGHPTLGEVDVARVVRESLGFLESSLARQGIVVAIDAPEAPLVIPGDAAEMQQVCLNLLTNAIHAMPSGGRLEVGLRRIERRKEGLALAAPQSYLLLEVADTGIGIQAADRDRIFEPFFTTKPGGEGTGLGLTVASGIVKDHDGWIEADDRPGGGAILRVYLPATAEAAAAPARATGSS